MQTERQASLGQQGYWDLFWDADDIFYGHVLGFKGMERRALVLCVNEDGTRDRAAERLYVGLSRATDRGPTCCASRSGSVTEPSSASASTQEPGCASARLAARAADHLTLAALTSRHRLGSRVSSPSPGASADPTSTCTSARRSPQGASCRNSRVLPSGPSQARPYPPDPPRS